MILRLIKNNRTSGIIVIGLLLSLLWLKSFLLPTHAEEFETTPLYRILFSFLDGRENIAGFFGLLSFILLSVLLIRVNGIHYLLEDRSFMPATFYLLITASFPSVFSFNPILISCIFLILSLIILTRGNEHQADPIAIFNASLLIAAGSLFYLKLIWFIPFLWITALIIRPLSWRGLVNPFLVLCMMILFYFTYYWVIKDDLPLLFSIFSNNLSAKGTFQGFSQSQWFILAYLLILILLSSVYLLQRLQAKKIKIRKIYQVLFFLFIYSLLFYVFISGFRIEAVSIIAIPLSYLFSNFFHRKKKHWIYEVLLWIWIGLLVYMQIR